MPIRNITSTLPDRDYIRALEDELRDLKATIERLQTEVVALQRG